uniref:Serpin family B member 5 n=1 Tax=Leptobrachium leishanense TaxID=445787 RepID=A0A8C5MPX0_9ANUR
MDALRLANTALAVDILKKFFEKSKTDNIIFSPLCVSTSLALALKGSKENTAAEFIKVLHVEKVKDCDFGFQSLNSDIAKISSIYSIKLIKRLYIEKSLNCTKNFVDSTKKPYPSELEEIDINSQPEEARNQINTSIKELTDGKFETSLNEGTCDENTKILLVGAAHFKANWLYKFNETETKEMDFHINKRAFLAYMAEREYFTIPWTSTGFRLSWCRFTFFTASVFFFKTETKPVQMMHLEARLSIGYINDLETTILEIPCTGKQISLLLLLPKCIEDDSTGLKKLEEDITFEKYVHWTNPSMMANSKVKLCLPKFKMECSYVLNDTLKSLGLNDAFNEEASDFSGMSESKGIVLSQAIQNACIEIDEEGTETADVTKERLLMHKDEFVVDHPFLFIVRHNKSRTVLMCGRYCSPPSTC